MFPLGLLTTGETAEVIKIRAKGDKKVAGASRGSLTKKGSDSCTRIEDMGFRSGRVVEMINNGRNPQAWCDSVIERLSTMEEGSSILIPMRVRPSKGGSHGMYLVAVRKSDDPPGTKHFRLVQANSGAGIHKYHHRDQKMRKDQLVLEYDELSWDKISDRNCWRRL